MDESQITHVGRPYGGCAVIWHRRLLMTFNPITTTSKRLCAVNIVADNVNIILINVYMPNDDNCDSSFNEYGDILCEISSIIQLYDSSDIILGGDFNVDFSRVNSRNLQLLKQFLDYEPLLCASLQVISNNFTRECSLGNRSFIDHFIVSSNFNYNVDVLYDGNNLSDHNPITIQTTYRAKLSDQEHNNQNRLNWDNATNINISNYQSMLDMYMNDFEIPQDIPMCNNFMCNQHSSLIIDLMDEYMDVLIDCANIAIPKNRMKNKGGIPGWNTFVQPFKDKSILWNDIWKSAGCPRNGQLAQIRRLTRAKYYWAIKKVKRDRDKIILNNTAQQLANKAFKDFWHTIKNIKNSNRYVSNVVDGLCTDNDISNNFKDIYKSLYNSVPDENFERTINKVNSLITSKCSQNKCTASDCHETPTHVIKEAINSLNNGKDDEIYGLTSDNFLNASEMAINKFSILINAMLRHGCTSQSMNKAVIKPIPKNKQKSQSDSANYRAISKNTIISKIIDYVILFKISKNLSTSSFQFAYKKGFSTTLCSFLVAETLQYYKSQGSNVFMLSLDATKAFDRVQYSKLFNSLIEKDVCPLMIRFIINVYITSTAVVSWNNTQSESFSIKNGVKQGAVLSAPMFAVYIDPLIIRLKKSKRGCHIGNICANAFAYADDLVLLSPSCTALKILITICEIFSNEFMLQFNPDKCTLLIFSNMDYNFENINITMCGQRIKNVRSEKHLGHIFNSVSYSNFNIISFDSVIRDLKVRTNTIINQFRPISWESKVKLFLSQCSGLYGCPLWRLADPQLENLYTTWRVCSRRVLGVHYRTRSRLLSNLMDTLPIKDIVMSRMLNFVINGLNNDNELISMYFKNMLTSNTSYMLTNVNKILQYYNIRYNDLFTLNKSNVRQIIYKKNGVEDWRCNFIKELLTLKENPSLSILNTFEIEEILNFISTE